MSNEQLMSVFEDFRIRRVYDEETETWYFSVVDIIAALIEQRDYQTARKYWNKLKERLRKEGSQSVTDCHQLKLAAADGKKYATDVADPQTLQRLRIGYVSGIFFTIGGRKLQLVTICHRLASFLPESLLELVPVLPCGLVVPLFNQGGDDIHHGKIPGFCFLVVDTSNPEVLKNRHELFVAHQFSPFAPIYPPRPGQFLGNGRNYFGKKQHNRPAKGVEGERRRCRRDSRLRGFAAGDKPRPYEGGRQGRTDLRPGSTRTTTERRIPARQPVTLYRDTDSSSGVPLEILVQSRLAIRCTNSVPEVRK